MRVRILYNTENGPQYIMDPGPFSMVDPYSKPHIGYGHLENSDPRVQMQRRVPYSIIEYGQPGPHSIENMDPGSTFHGSILYMTQ